MPAINAFMKKEVTAIDEFTEREVNTVNVRAIHGAFIKAKAFTVNRYTKRGSIVDAAELKLRQCALKSLTEMKSRFTNIDDLESSEKGLETDDPMFYPMRVSISLFVNRL
jgi:hypothetical protein